MAVSVRPVLAIVATPLMASAAMLITSSDVREDWLLALGFFPLVYFFAFLAEVLIALPLFLLLLRAKLVTWWSALLGGAAVACFTDVLIRALRVPGTPELLRFAAIGAISGLSFWWIWRGSIGMKSAG